MDKNEKLAQIADLAKIIERLVKEYNGSVDGYEAQISDVHISTKNDFCRLETEIHLHGDTENLDIDFGLTGKTEYDTHTVNDYGCRFHGVHLTDCQFEWHLDDEKEAASNASMAV